MYNKRAFFRQMNHNKSGHGRSCHGSSRKHGWYEKFGASYSTPPANVRELDDKYELHLFAPGYEKSDFIIAIIDQTLSITVKEKTEDQRSWKRLEHINRGFVRQFDLSEKIDKEGITARYENGVLIITLHKLEGFETTRKEIEIV
jgi:HSP20 family protein